MAKIQKVVVVATAKVQIFKQITTCTFVFCKLIKLLLLPQRYKFSSKSQRHLEDFASSVVVVATAKVQIFKQITTPFSFGAINSSCCCYRKGTNFQANHNWRNSSFSPRRVVVATAKVQIFKQITTGCTGITGLPELLLLPQRYKFSSKSQPLVRSDCLFLCCCCYRKGTNFQANHNLFSSYIGMAKVVVATAKVQIFKQITTVTKR